MSKQYRLIITKEPLRPEQLIENESNQRSHAIWTVLQNQKKAVQIRLQSEDADSSLRLHNVYVGKVKDVVKNINAAFIDLGNGKQGFYSMETNTSHLYTDVIPVEETEESCFSGRKLRQGDEILVQVERDAVKTKDPVLTSRINVTGRYAVLTVGKPGLGISGKISDGSWKKQARERLQSLCTADCGFILRTNAGTVPFEVIEEEMRSLRERFYAILKKGRYSTCYSLVYQEESAYLSSLRDLDTGKIDEIVTDIRTVYDELSTYLSAYQPENLGKLRFYQDDLLPLFKLYSLKESLQGALKKHVWLKSGGYLVIEPTEALTVIDVNTGKFVGKKTPRETIRKINLEAAQAVGEQMRLRNLSGIIIVDFIDMEYEEDDLALLETMTKIAAADPVKTTVVDMTPLHLMEITRKKVERPLVEQAASLGIIETMRENKQNWEACPYEF